MASWASDDSFSSELTGRAAIGRDGGQDTQGAWQGSIYQVTIRPTGRCAARADRNGRQLNANAPRARRGTSRRRGQTDPDDASPAILD